MAFNKLMESIIFKSLVSKGNNALNELLECSNDAAGCSEKILMQLMQDNKDTEYGKKYHFDQVKSVEDYKRLVPVSNYDDYAEMIERNINDSVENLFSSKTINAYVLTSGSVGVPKYIPQSEEAIDVYRKYASYRVFASANQYFQKKGMKHFPYGRGFNTFEITKKPTKSGKYLGTISGTALRAIEKFLPVVFTSPAELISPTEKTDTTYLKLLFALADKNVTFILSCFMSALVIEMDCMKKNWQQLCDDIEHGRVNPDLEMSDELRGKLNAHLKADKARADELRREFEKGFDDPIIPRIWPNMGWLAAVGSSSFMPFTDKMRTYLGKDIPIDFLNYAASEALMGSALQVEDDSYILVPQAGFFEFVPEDAMDYSVTYTADELEVGKKYEILVTNLSGFYRYKINDVVEIVGYYNKAPKMKFAYRKSQLLNMVGEKMTEQDVQLGISKFSQKTGIEVIDYAIYPDRDHVPPRYVMLLEPTSEIDLSKVDEYEEVLEESLCEASYVYKFEREPNSLAHVKLHIQQQDSHIVYREMMLMKGVTPNQLKPVRVLDTLMKQNFFMNLIEK